MSNIQSFDDRMRGIERRHRKLARGYKTVVTREGLIVHKPRTRFRFPVRGLVLTIAAIWVFKAFLFAYQGPGGYNSRVDSLASGTAIEQAGAWVMQADRATIWMAEQGKLALVELGALF